LKDARDPHLKNIQPLRDADSVNNQPGGAYLMRSATPEEVPTRLAADKVSFSQYCVLFPSFGLSVLRWQPKFLAAVV